MRVDFARMINAALALKGEHGVCLAPGCMLLLGAGIIGLLGVRRRGLH